MRGGGGDTPAAPVVRPPGSTSGGGTGAIAAPFNPPASFIKQAPNGKGTYMKQGQDAQITLKNAKGPDAKNIAVSQYQQAISSPQYKVSNDKRKTILKALPELKQPLQDIKVDGSTEFRFANIKAGNPYD